MLDIKDKLSITEQDFQYFKDEWIKTVPPKPFDKKIEISKDKLEWMRRSILESNNSNFDFEDEHPVYKFNLYEDTITVCFWRIVYTLDGWSCHSTGPSLEFVKIRQSFKDHDTYHCYNQNTVYDVELFFMNNLEHYQKNLEGVKQC